MTSRYLVPEPAETQDDRPSLFNPIPITTPLPTLHQVMRIQSILTTAMAMVQFLHHFLPMHQTQPSIYPHLHTKQPMDIVFTNQIANGKL